MNTITTVVTNPSPPAQLDVEIEKVEKYNPEFVSKVLKGDDDFEIGYFKVIKSEDLWISL